MHRHLSRPITLSRNLRRSAAEKQTGTYVVCLRCGKKFPYDWKQMRVVPLARAVSARREQSQAKEPKAQQMLLGLMQAPAEFVKRWLEFCHLRRSQR